MPFIQYSVMADCQSCLQWIVDALLSQKFAFFPIFCWCPRSTSFLLLIIVSMIYNCKIYSDLNHIWELFILDGFRILIIVLSSISILLAVKFSGISKCTEICYKDPVLEDQQWSAYIDRSPGQDSYSLECFNACVSGCGFRFDIPAEKVEQIKPNRPSKPPPPPAAERATNSELLVKGEDVPCTSA
ncbi:hypothetical protein GUJ93_ZPchr0458g22334 [Zizania palustris]|uniref:Uncharacterized protein n=1 Tax=Zizania palustris TaxID=103762 RepID=A0A8J5V2T9_ZIZPA|nr:hypothetical protein GUJ93_ZPchr0458g22334 [Zizania palustris]